MTTSLRIIVVLLSSAVLTGSLVSWGQMQVEPESSISLSLKIAHDASEMGTATGFVLKKSDKNYLVTNRHVVLACTQDQNPANVGGWICANKLAIFHNHLGHPGSRLWKVEDLFDRDGRPRWLEHPTLRGAADVVALPLANTVDVQFYPLDLETMNTDITLGPAEPVSIVGFPFGLAQSPGLPIWKTGTIASDLDIDFRGSPVFLVDSTTRPGMSGSPVYAARFFAVSSKGFGFAMGPRRTKFLGVYSEQIPAAEIGGVWKAKVVKELYDSLP
jgi:hypothetical protein